MLRPHWRALAGAGFVVAVTSCAHFDTTPLPAQHGTLGEEIYQSFCERMAAEANPNDVSGTRWKPVCEGRVDLPGDAPPRLRALHQNRARFVEAVDRILPEAIEDDLSLFLGELLPLYDPPRERLPQQTRRLADLLARIARDDQAVAALERVGQRRGYRPLRLALGVARPVMAYPELDDFTGLALRTLLPGGAAHDEFTELQRALALEMATLTVDRGGPTERSTLSLMRELMFTEDDAFAGASPQWVVLRDERGFALPDGVDAPFIDADLDGLADLDVLGRFIGSDGLPIDVPAPFRIADEAGIARDASGRALRSDGSRYFAYLDADRTMLHGMAAEMRPMFDPDAPTLINLARGMPLLMGQETTAGATFGSFTHNYPSYDPATSSMLDVVYALGHAMHRPQTDDALIATEALLRDHESELAGVLRAARFTANQGDLYPNARLEQPNNLWDDLIDVVRRMAERPGMLEAVMRSFTDPRSAQLGTIYGNLMRHRDRVTYNPTSPNGAPVGLPLDEGVDRNMPDTWENESLFQRSIGLIDALNGVRVCNKEGAVLNIRVLGIPIRYPLIGTAGECDIIRIDNVAEAYALSILGRYRLELQSGFLSAITTLASSLGISVDAALEEASGIDGLTQTPTPQAMNRLVFWALNSRPGGNCAAQASDCNSEFAGQLFTPVRDRHGNDVITRWQGTIFAWEMPGFYEGMTPMLEVLHDSRYRADSQGRYMFGELIGALWQHWPSRQSTETCRDCGSGAPNFSFQSNGRSYEELVADSFVDARFMERLADLTVSLDAVQVRSGVDGIDAMSDATLELVDPARNAGLTTRDGRAQVPVNDGSRNVAVTPLYLVLEGLRAMDRDLATDPERRAAWEAGRHALAEQMLGTTTLGDQFRFESQRLRAILLTALPFMRERVADHRARGDVVEWSTTLHERMGETMTSPLGAALMRFLAAIDADPEARSALSRLMAYLVDEASANDAFASTLYGLTDAMMVLEDEDNLLPILHALADGMAPNARGVVAGTEPTLDTEASAIRDLLELTSEIRDLDTQRTLPRILQNAAALPETGDEITPIEVLIDVIAEVNRAAPGAGGTMSADDYRAAFGQTVDFMTDERRGMERLYDVIQNRQLAPTAP